MRRIAISVMLLHCGCSEDPTTPATVATPVGGAPWFEDVAGSSGIDFAWQSGHETDYRLPEIIGGGAALIDYDSDGDLDVYLVQGGDLDAAWSDSIDNALTNTLYRNDGDWRFTDVTGQSGAGDAGYGMGVAAGDIDGDGDVDLYVTNMGRDSLLRNDGGVFVDATEQAGIESTTWSASAAFVDIDGDADLDLYVTTYLEWTPETELDCMHDLGGEDYCSPRNYMRPTTDTLYRNRGDGTFENITNSAGIDTATGTGLGVVAADWTGDGFMDIFVANDGMPDHLWVNQGDGTFLERGLSAGCALDDEGAAKAGMGVDTTDIDDDGDLDLIVCNLKGESDSLFRNDGGRFSDVTTRSGLRRATRGDTRFGIGLIDFDNDGWLDLYEANGAVYRLAKPHTDDPYAQRDMLVQGSGNGRFTPVSPRGGTLDDIILTSRGAAFGDLDNDGRMDIVVVNRDAPANVYRNITGASSRWVGLDIRNATGSAAVGAVVSGLVGDRRMTRPVHRAGSYLSSSDPKVLLGLGQADVLEDVRVSWPDGRTTSIGDLEAGVVHRIGPGHSSQKN